MTSKVRRNYQELRLEKGDDRFPNARVERQRVEEYHRRRFQRPELTDLKNHGAPLCADS